MKSKAEILKAVDTCIFLGGSCCDCPYFDELDCVNQISKDLHALLNKSDFEVMKEILDRSKLSAEGRIDYYNQPDWSIISLDGYEEVDLEFDYEGNIL